MARNVVLRFLEIYIYIKCTWSGISGLPTVRYKPTSRGLDKAPICDALGRGCVESTLEPLQPAEEEELSSRCLCGGAGESSSRSLLMWIQKNLELLTLSTIVPLMVIGGVSFSPITSCTPIGRYLMSPKRHFWAFSVPHCNTGRLQNVPALQVMHSVSHVCSRLWLVEAQKVTLKSNSVNLLGLKKSTRSSLYSVSAGGEGRKSYPPAAL